MKKNKYIIMGFIFLILSGVIIYSVKLDFLLFPTQKTELRGELEYGALTNEFLFMQEITAEKEYLAAVDIVMASSGAPYLNDNTLMILDANYIPLYVHLFTNERMNKSQYQRFDFSEKIHVGKGNKIILCLSTFTGDKTSHLTVPRIATGKLGRLSVKPLVNRNVFATLKSPGQVFLLEGSLCLRTYESNYGSVNWAKVFLLILAVLITSAIIFAEKVWGFIIRLKLVPEKTYFILAMIFGLSMVFITPPFQVPDEFNHFFRAYQVSEGTLVSQKQDARLGGSLPKSLPTTATPYRALPFHAENKQSIDDIFNSFNIPLNKSDRVFVDFPNTALYSPVPYLPQALGVSSGKIFQASPLILLYLGRLSNLFVWIILIFIAIRITPIYKWLFMLLALTPMSLFLAASLSADCFTNAIAFLAIAMFLYYAFANEKMINTGCFLKILAITLLIYLYQKKK